MEKFFLESLAIYFLFCYNGDMRTVYETEKLRRLLTIFCDLTEITITLFDSNMTSIIDVNAGEWKNYCLAIGDDETRLKLCKQCDAQHAEEARKKKDIVIYACHGMPLRYNKDKRKNPVFSRVSAFVVAYSIPFPTLIANEKSVE